MSILEADAWADRRYYGGDLPAEAEREIHLAGLAWEDPEAIDQHLAQAMALAPGHLAVHLAHYKSLFYRHRYHEAAPHALAVVGIKGRELGLCQDWRMVEPTDAAFDGLEPGPRLFVHALAAYGYVLVRSGDMVEGRDALTQAASLDFTGYTGARAVLDLLDRGQGDDDED
jgi:hypothetical protein